MRRGLAALASALALTSIAAGSHAQRSAGAITIDAGGDLLLQPRVVSAARSAIDGFDRVVAPLRLIARSDDVAFANLESPLSEEVAVTSGSPPTLGAPADAAAALARAGLDVISVANNHAWDQGARGAALTVAALDAAGIDAIGAGATDDEAFAPHVLRRGGLRVAFVGVTMRVNAGPGHDEPSVRIATWRPERVASAVERARELADVVVVSIHWSHDFWEGPREEERERARFLVEHGADVILGHGPHVLHPVERLASPRGEAVCAYSLGNLVSNQGFAYHPGQITGGHEATWRPESRDGAWLRLRVRVEQGRVAIGAIEAVPLFTYNNYLERDQELEEHEDIRIQRLEDVSDAALRSERREAIARALGPLVTLVPR